MRFFSKENLKKAAIGAALLGANGVAGYELYQSHLQIDRLKASNAALHSRINFAEQMAEMDAYISCRTALSLRGLPESQDREDCNGLIQGRRAFIESQTSQ